VAATTRGAGITAGSTTTPVAITLAPNTPALPTGLVRSPSVRPPEPAALCAILIAPRRSPGHRLPLVALVHSGTVAQWRQDYLIPQQPAANSGDRYFRDGPEHEIAARKPAARGLIRALGNQIPRPGRNP
jgi:hypothetical protein